MRRWIPFALSLTVAAMMAAFPMRGGLHARPAQAAETFEVVVGTDVEADLVETNAFLPDTIAIAAGDSVSWRFAGFHTVTFTAGNAPPDLIVPGLGPGELQIGPGGFAIPPGPMPPSGPYDGRTLVNSGTPAGDPSEEPPFTLTFTTPGVYSYLCVVHFGMKGTVTVLPAGSALPETPAQVMARGQAQLGAIQGLLKTEAQGARQARVSGPGGVSVQTVSAGINTPLGGSMLRFMPDNVTVRRGDLVTFANADTFNIHTVTFTSGATPPEFLEVVPGPAGPPQLIIRANVAGPTGGTTYTGQSYLNSGILFPGQAFAINIDAPAGTYSYLCLIHGSESGGMRGTITVTE